MHFFTWHLLKWGVIIGGQLLLLLSWYYLTHADSPNQQGWEHVGGSCGSELEGAVFGISGTGCGGNGTSFDSQQIYNPVIIKDTASPAAPCPGIASGNVCYRLWYVGDDVNNVPGIGYAVSADGVSWSRVVGGKTGGSVFEAGASGNFDSYGVSYFTVMKDSSTYKMWYSGYGASHSSDLAEGIGYATSSDGQNWTRVSGALTGGAVLIPSGVAGTFDQHEVYVPFVLKDRASATAPCAGVSSGEVCYRMWYEGANTSAGYRFLIGYATSPDGLNWSRVAGSGSGGAALGAGPSGFDDNSVGIAVVIKDGALYRMWYEAKGFSNEFTLGHVVSVDGLNWVRPTPNEPVYDGSDDPGTAFDPDQIWSHNVLKEGASYRMWYTVSTKPNSKRFGLATMTPGTEMDGLDISQVGDSYTLSFTPTSSIPAGGSVLLTLPAEIPFEEVTAEGLSGFGAGATLSADPAAVSDVVAGNVARGALVVRLTATEPAGPKAVQFSLGGLPTTVEPVLVQTFNTREVLEHGTTTFSLTTPALTITDQTVTEGDAGTVAAIFTVTLLHPGGQTAIVDYATDNNTAIAPGDYLTTSGTLTFTTGITQQTITVNVQGDVVDEPDETYFVNLNNPAGALILDGQAQGTIIDDDLPSQAPDELIYLPLILR